MIFNLKRNLLNIVQGLAERKQAENVLWRKIGREQGYGIKIIWMKLGRKGKNVIGRIQRNIVKIQEGGERRIWKEKKSLSLDLKMLGDMVEEERVSLSRATMLVQSVVKTPEMVGEILVSIMKPLIVQIMTIKSWFVEIVTLRYIKSWVNNLDKKLSD